MGKSVGYGECNAWSAMCGGQCVEGSVGDSVGSSVAQVLPLHLNNNNNKQNKKNVGQG